MQRQVIHLHVDAAPKPAWGEPCNGCGVCCASEPCPVGVLVSRRRHGACAALVWVEREAAYRCGVVAQPQAHLPRALRAAAPMLSQLARRFISAGSGCDSSVEVEVEAGERRGP